MVASQLQVIPGLVVEASRIQMKRFKLIKINDPLEAENMIAPALETEIYDLKTKMAPSCVL